MTLPLGQVEVPSEGLESGLYMPLYLLLVLYVILFVAGRVLDGRGDDRADKVQDAGFALMLLGAVYVAVLAVYAFASEFELIVALLGIELLVGLAGRRRREGVEVPPPSPDSN